jgi:two-component system sensor histidine kinase RstB
MIFINLYSNALKYSKSKIKIILDQNDKNEFSITIEDDGQGILKKDREKIFMMFEQINSEVLTRETKGTGIGLYTVKYFSELSNLDIQVDDSENLGGAKFVLKLLNKNGENN